MTGFATRAIHAGQDPDPLTGAVIVPIYQTSTFAQDVRRRDPRRVRLFPRRQPHPHRVGAGPGQPGGGPHGYAFASGMAAVGHPASGPRCRPGDHLIIPDDAYGGTFRLIDKICVPWGSTHSTVALGDLDAVRAAMRPDTRMIWCETPTNPLLGIADIAALAEIAHGADAQLLVDNTFASPYLQQPLALGADVVLHSTTKYIGGHSDVSAARWSPMTTNSAESPRLPRKSMGAIAGPFDAWLTLRGVKTLARADGPALRQRRGGRRRCWSGTRGRTGCYYPGLPAHPGHEIAAKQMRRFGGMVSFTVVGGQEEAFKVCRAHPAVHPGRVARRGGVAHRAPRPDDPR